MIKVLQINKLYYPETGGVERIVQQLAEGLKDRMDMKVLVCRRKGRTLIEEVNGIEVCRTSSFGMAFSMPVSLSFFNYFRKAVKDRDIIHIHMPFPLADIAVALYRYRGKIVLWWHSDILRQKFFLALYKPFMRGLLRCADTIMVATQAHIDNSDFLPEFRDKCVVIPFGVKANDKNKYWESHEGSDRNEYRESHEGSDKNKYRESHAGSDSDAVVILFVGRLVYYKGCEILLEAFGKITGARLRIVGSGVLEDKLKRISANFSNKVDFLGNISDEEVAREFSDCDIFVLPSVEKTEAFGIVQIEAMSQGKPVINTKLPSGVPLVSLDGLTGITVPPSDVQSLAEAMQKLVDNKELRLEYGRNAYKRAIEEFSESVMLDRVFKQYESLVK